MDRPKVRGDCKDGPRPCLWTECRYHLDHEKERKDGSEDTCALDVADLGQNSLSEVAHIYGLTKEAIRLIEVKALSVLRTDSVATGLKEINDDE